MWSARAVIELPIDTASKERFLSKLDRRAGKKCWVWQASQNKQGYGHFGYRGRILQSHRFAYALFNGTIDPMKQIDHLCGNTSCCNPAHLEAVTPDENTKRSTVGAAQREKTHCANGHEFTGKNTYWRPDGARSCRRCKADQIALRRSKGDKAKEPKQNQSKTHCLNGHEFSEENTYTRKNGFRICRACARSRRLKWLRKL